MAMGGKEFRVNWLGEVRGNKGELRGEERKRDGKVWEKGE